MREKKSKIPAVNNVASTHAKTQINLFLWKEQMTALRRTFTQKEQTETVAIKSLSYESFSIYLPYLGENGAGTEISNRK